MSRPNWHPGVCTVLGAWAWAGMRPLSEKSPASTDRRLHGREGEGAEEYSQEEPGRSVPGISFQAQHEESSSQWDESTESMDLGGGLFHRTDGSTGQCGVEREQRPQRKKVHWGQDGVLPPVCRLSYWR